MTYTPDQTISVIEEEVTLNETMFPNEEHPDLDEHDDPDERPANAWDLRGLSAEEVEWTRSYWH